METRVDPYEDAVRLYINMIKQDSLEAGCTLEQLHAAFGTRAALRATLVIRLLKMIVKERYSITDFSLFDDIIRAYPETINLLEHAIMCCCDAWNGVDGTAIYPRGT